MNAIEQAIEALETAQRFIPESAYRESYDKCTEAITALQSMQGEAVGWRTEDYDTDKSATTYDSDCADRWRAKGWPVESLYTQPKSPAVVDSFGIIPLDMRYAEPKARIENSMKSQCMGEFSWQEEAPYYDEDGELHEDYVATHVVPWDICKDIYQKMASIAMLSASQSGKGE